MIIICEKYTSILKNAFKFKLGFQCFCAAIAPPSHQCWPYERFSVLISPPPHVNVGRAAEKSARSPSQTQHWRGRARQHWWGRGHGSHSTLNKSTILNVKSWKTYKNHQKICVFSWFILLILSLLNHHVQRTLMFPQKSVSHSRHLESKSTQPLVEVKFFLHGVWSAWRPKAFMKIDNFGLERMHVWCRLLLENEPYWSHGWPKSAE